MVKYLETQAEFDAFREEHKDKLVVIDFTASWCGPCKHIAPAFEKLANEYPNVAFAKVDVDNNSEVAESEGVSAMPSFFFYKNGDKIDSITGANEAKLEELIKKYQK
ncbi:thioredoxin-like [Dendronephthya gigantea]|uniref:thioredoxin-like n=1 Tax=Dendronephthya gigantea TaxID=151771 RepID=UPI00106A16E7|nr:thioredoxin-like [Dendronephthya gigantea]